MTPEQIKAADAYIAEREAKREAGLNVKPHLRYNANIGPVYYAGTRVVDGQPLALLRRGEAIMVLPIDQSTAQRLKRVSVGAEVAVERGGKVKKAVRKGLSQ